MLLLAERRLELSRSPDRPELEGLKQLKGPTIIQYDATDPNEPTMKCLEIMAQRYWGYRAPTWHEDLKLPRPKSTAHIAGDFIRAIYNYAIGQIKSTA
jgi:hypothetical protein